ncbi:MAG: SRPBCC family protein [Blastocatellia bacterium]
MPHGSVTAIIPAPSADVFRLLHDYGRRLEWDTLLQEAYLTDDWTEAQLHATSVCKGRSHLGGIALKTEYLSFNPPEVAAVRMVNRPPFFQTFAATIRHRDIEDGSSQIEYKYNFTARPRWLRWMLHPLMAVAFRYETRKRLQALRGFFTETEDKETRRAPDGTATHT